MRHPIQKERISPATQAHLYHNMHAEHERFMNETINVNDALLQPYMVQAAALQQRLAYGKVVNSSSAHNENRKLDSSPSSTVDPKYPMLIVGRDGKLARPFKAYPRDPLSITAAYSANDSAMDQESTVRYQEFRKHMVEQIREANGGHATITNPKMRRISNKISAAEDSDDVNVEHGGNGNNNNSDSGSVKDSAYFERRKKNNAAAKKSRDRRRIKEDEIAIRAAFLERENLQLKCELQAIRKQLALCSSPS